MSAQQAKGHRWFAAIYDRLMAGPENTFMKGIRQEVVGGARGQVLEIGCGTGASFPYYQDSLARIVATEPDPYMLERAKRRAAQLAKPIELQQAPAEVLPFPDASFDAVISTLVLCTVKEPLKALSEVRRVLRPDGQFRFYEHVRYDHAFGAFWQDLITPLWRWFAAGCHPNRDVEGFLHQAGFAVVQIQRLQLYPPIPPMAFARPHIMGIASP